MKFYAMPTHDKARVNPTKPETAEFYEPGDEALIVFAVTGPTSVTPKVRVVRSWGFPGLAVGETVEWVTDTGRGYRERGSTAVVVGYREPGGVVHGELPNKALPYYHAK